MQKTSQILFKICNIWLKIDCFWFGFLKKQKINAKLNIKHHLIKK